MSLTWQKYVPDAMTSRTAKPLNWDRLVQQQMPVMIAEVATVAGGAAVTLPAAFTAVITETSEYTVTLSKQTFNVNGGELYVSDKTTSGFKVRNGGSSYGETVSVVVWWLRP
jgi:hypothetical protein